MAMIKCPECGEMISSTAKRCIHCGGSFTVCSECGQVFGGDVSTCSACGNVLRQNRFLQAGGTESVVLKKEEEGKSPQNLVQVWLNNSPSLKALYTFAESLPFICWVIAALLGCTVVVKVSGWVKTLKGYAASGGFEGSGNALQHVMQSEQFLEEISTLCWLAIICFFIGDYCRSIGKGWKPIGLAGFIKDNGIDYFSYAKNIYIDKKQLESIAYTGASTKQNKFVQEINGYRSTLYGCMLADKPNVLRSLRNKLIAEAILCIGGVVSWASFACGWAESTVKTAIMSVEAKPDIDYTFLIVGFALVIVSSILDAKMDKTLARQEKVWEKKLLEEG